MSETPTLAQPATGPSLRERWESVRSRIADAARRSGRQPGSVLLVVISKSASLDQIRELVQLGQVDFGENRVQQLVQRVPVMDEFVARRRELGGSAASLRWHMVGTLQRNKVRKCIDLVRLIHSVDNLRLAEEIQVATLRRENRDPKNAPTEPVEVLIEVNVAGEKSKQGAAPAAVRHLIDQIDTMVNLRVRGLMCMAPLEGGLDAARRTFERCRELYEDVRRAGAGGESFDILSMGMSGDFEAAIEFGANVVRVGSAIFGAPAQPDEADEG
ncbi:MAG: YggS family pyridoxal phosphate-dependent enzyme [Phycisphaeraceae bacterium]|nr:YggS family pyridoxal phosphate-dependent enzyme [Phycisphaeraceae bacterium]